jgi:ABC-type methionine transport system permease subunit
MPMNVFDLNNIENVINLGKKSALFSFLLGSIIIVFYYFTHYNSVIYFSLFFIIVAFIVNTTIAIYLIIGYFKYKPFKNAIIKTLLLMIVNIPIGLFYLDLGFTLYSKF